MKTIKESLFIFLIFFVLINQTLNLSERANEKLRKEPVLSRQLRQTALNSSISTIFPFVAFIPDFANIVNTTAVSNIFSRVIRFFG